MPTNSSPSSAGSAGKRNGGEASASPRWSPKGSRSSQAGRGARSHGRTDAHSTNETLPTIREGLFASTVRPCDCATVRLPLENAHIAGPRLHHDPSPPVAEGAAERVPFDASGADGEVAVDVAARALEVDGGPGGGRHRQPHFALAAVDVHVPG